jgi:hypothetical protein
LYRSSSTETTCFSFGQSLLNEISQLHPPTTRFPVHLDSSERESPLSPLDIV